MSSQIFIPIDSLETFYMKNKYFLKLNINFVNYVTVDANGVLTAMALFA